MARARSLPWGITLPDYDDSDSGQPLIVLRPSHRLPFDWMLDVGCWMLDVGCWMLDVGCSMLDVRCWMFDAGCSMLDVRCWMLDVHSLHLRDARCQTRILNREPRPTRERIFLSSQSFAQVTGEGGRRPDEGCRVKTNFSERRAGMRSRIESGVHPIARERFARVLFCRI